METPIENSVITDEAEAKFLEAAALADAGQDIPVNLVPAEPADTATATENKEENPGGQTQTDNSDTDPEKKDDRPRDNLGRFTKTKEGADIPEAERQPAEKPVETKPSDYEAKKQEQKQKEQERLEKTWENVNRRKEELEARERALQQQEQSLRQQVQQPQQFQEQRREFSSRDLFEASRDFKGRAKRAFKQYQETGDETHLDAFNENTALAEQAEEHAQQFYQVEAREAQQAQMQQYNQVWSGNMQKAIEADPDLVKPESALAKAVHALLEKHGQVFWMLPDGFPRAVEYAKTQIEAGSASELREANKKLQAEVERLNGLTAIGGSGPTSQPAPKKIEDMSDEEQGAYFLRAAQAVDNGQLT